MTAREALATVGPRVIRMADIERRMRRIAAEEGADALPAEGSPAADRLVRWVLHALVGEAVIRDEASREGASRDGASRDGARWGRRPATPGGTAPRRHVGGDSLEDGVPYDVVVAVFEAVTSGVQIPVEDVARYYTANVDRYVRPEIRRVQHAVVGDEATASTVAAVFRDGNADSDPPEPAPPVPPVEPTSLVEPTLIDVDRARFAGPFGEAVFAASVGDVVGPLATELGWHVAKLTAVVPASTRSLDDVRDDILADLLAAERGRVFDEWLEVRRREAVIAPGYECPGDPRSDRHVHRH